MNTETPDPDFALYTRARCAFCFYVVRAIRALGLDVEMRDIAREPEHRHALVAATGRMTVPVLRISHDDGREEWMPESRNIVRYLHKHYS
ncbi:MAG: glutaredoxin [Proteobacteria bacterium]|nr:glutaredoxin [Pseudomonadota bacterium]